MKISLKIFGFIFAIMLTSIIANAQSDTIIWPGDINNNGIVNQYDLLYLGTVINMPCDPRDSISTEWEGQTASPNNQGLFFGDINIGFADCNGDGVVDSLDQEAIDTNFGLIHNNIANEDFTIINGNMPSMRFSGGVSNIALSNNQAYTFNIDLGSANNIVEDFYGIAFSINVNTDYVDFNSVVFELDQFWINPNQSTILSIVKKDFNTNQLHISIVRTDYSSVIGFSSIGKLSIVIEGNVPSATDVEIMNFEDVYMTNPYLEVREVDVQGLTIDVQTSVENPLQEKLDIYPTVLEDNQFNISGLEQLNNYQVNLYNTLGQKLEITIQNEQIEIKNPIHGIYFLEVISDEGRLVQSLISN